MTEMIITSLRNPMVKRLKELQQKSSERRKSGLFVVEGQRELQHCLDARLVIDTVFWCEEILPDLIGGLKALLRDGKGPTKLVRVSRNVYEKVAYRGGTEGLMAQVEARQLALSSLPCQEMGKNPLYVVLESVEKPGNLGAVLRSADAAGVDAVIVCDPLTDLYNPNLIRSSIGAFFSVPTVACSSEECIEWLHRNGIQILTAQLQDSSLYYDTDMTPPTAIVMGTESTGLTSIWRQAADAHIRIPMLGCLDSLNVSVSAAILMFEAVRQRKK